MLQMIQLIIITTPEHSAWDVRRHPQLSGVALRDKRAYERPRQRDFKKPTSSLLVSDISAAALSLQGSLARVVAQTDRRHIGRSSSTSAHYQRPVRYDDVIGKWVTDPTRLSAFQACLVQVT